jgi:protein-disulfide isomerase
VLDNKIKALDARQQSLESQMAELHRTLNVGRPIPSLQGDTPAAVSTSIEIAGAPFRGERAAPITLIEFSDYQCGFCARHVRQIYPQIEREFIRTGKVRYVFRNFPVEARHRFAFKAHEAAACAGDQDRFWEMHGRLFAHQTSLAPDQLVEHAEALGLALPSFRNCLNTGSHAAHIRRDLSAGRAARVTGTPTFFVGLTNGSVASTITALRTIRGAKGFHVFKQHIEELLALR